MSEFTSRPFDEDELIAQIGRMNIFAISGGRVGVIRENNETVGIELPVSNGYRVSIKRDWNDTWTVSRQFVRAGVVFDKGTLTVSMQTKLAKLLIKHLASEMSNSER